MYDEIFTTFFFPKKKTFHLSSKIRDTDIIVGTNSFQCCDVKFEISNFLFRSISIINNNELFLNYQTLLFILPINYLFLPSSTKTETPQRKNNPFDPLDLFSTKKKKRERKSFLSPCTRVARIFLRRIFRVSNRFLRTPVRVQRTSNCFFIQQRTDTRPTGVRGWGKYWGWHRILLSRLAGGGGGGTVKTDKNSSNRGKLSDRKFIYSRLSSVAKSFTDIVEKCFWLLSEFHEPCIRHVKRNFFSRLKITFLYFFLLKLLLSNE